MHCPCYLLFRSCFESSLCTEEIYNFRAMSGLPPPSYPGAGYPPGQSPHGGHPQPQFQPPRASPSHPSQVGPGAMRGSPSHPSQLSGVRSSPSHSSFSRSPSHHSSPSHPSQLPPTIRSSPSHPSQIPGTVASAQSNSESDDHTKLRFQVELEFVQCLANPNYLHFLAQRGYMKDPCFINYLSYLQYWKEPNYVSFIKYPICLHFLELLQHETFRKEIVSGQCVRFLDDQVILHWQHYTRRRAKLFETAGTNTQAASGQTPASVK